MNASLVMKSHFPFRNSLIPVLGVIFVLTAQAATASENQRKREELAEMTANLRTLGLPGFLAETSNRRWVAPKMYSAWFISKMPEDPEGKKALELAKSGFGHEMARQLTPVAKIVRDTKDAALLENQMDVLFATIAWLGTETAYANMLLQERADDIASVAATKLMCDINYSMGKAEKVMKRFDERSWGSPEKIRQVLFEESAGKHFAVQSATISQDMLDKEFREGVSLVLKLGSTANRSDLEIFAREHFAQGESVMDLEKTWGKRAHTHFAQAGFGSVNLDNLVQLHEFRKRYGKFPTQPESIKPFPGESPIKAAFREISWENPYGIGGAWATFEAYLENRLVDEVFRETDSRFNPNAK